MEGLRCIFCGEEDSLRVSCSDGAACCSSCEQQADLADITKQLEFLDRLRAVMTIAGLPPTVPAVPKT